MAISPKGAPETGNRQHSRSIASDTALRHLLADMIRDYHKSQEKSRTQLAEEMSERLGPELHEEPSEAAQNKVGAKRRRRVTLHMLNSFTSERKKAARFPVAFVDCFSEITHDDRLRLELMGPRFRSLVAFALKALAIERNERELQQLRDELLKVEQHRG